MRDVIATLGTLKTKFIAFVKTYPIFILINAIMVTVVVIISCLSISSILPIGPELNDFAAYYYSAKALVENPARLYDAEWLKLTYNVNAFRYFPTMAILFLPFTTLPLIAGYILFAIISFIINIVNIFLVWEIIQKVTKKVDQKFLTLCTATYFVLAFHIDLFFQGQVSCLLALMLLLSLYFYLEKRDVLGGIFLGLSLIIKPITFLQIIFILFTTLAAKDGKKMIKRALWIFIPLIPVILWFLLMPSYLDGFVRVNFVDTTRTSVNWSVSFSNFFVSILSTDFNGTFIVCLLASLAVGVIIIWKLKEERDRILFSFIFGILAYFLTMTDIWVLQLPTLFPFLLIGAAFIDTQKRQKQFYALYLLYPCAAEFLGLMAIDPNLIIPVIPIVSFAILLLAILTTGTFYQKSLQVQKDVIGEGEEKS